MASILFPTRQRRDYLAVALASVAPQAAARGAEMIVVEDDPHDPEMAALAERHGARYIAHGEPRGLNAARNTAIDAASATPGSDLFCFLDDDVEVWPGWLDAMLAGARGVPGPRGARRPDPRAAGGLAPARLRPRAAPGHHARPRRRGHRRRVRVGREPHDPPRGDRARGRLRRVAADLRRRGGVPDAAEGRGRADPLRRRGRRRPPPAPAGTRRSGRWRGSAYFRGRNSRLNDVRKQIAPRPGRRAAHARRLRLAHRAARVRRRDRAHRAERRARRRDVRPAPAAAERRPTPTSSPAAPARSAGGRR